MDGGELIVRVLKNQGVRFAFTLCGGHISPVLVGAKKQGIRVIDVRQEPLYVANEGKLIGVIGPKDTDAVLAAVKQDPCGGDACIIGEVVSSHPGRVILETIAGGERIVEMPAGLLTASYDFSLFSIIAARRVVSDEPALRRIFNLNTKSLFEKQ